MFDDAKIIIISALELLRNSLMVVAANVLAIWFVAANFDYLIEVIKF